MATLLLVFGGTSMLFSKVAGSIYIPANNLRALPFLTPSLVFVICRLFNDDQHEVVPHYSSSLHYSNI